jgi:alginate O-acetyltransferase complex protein AlgI
MDAKAFLHSKNCQPTTTREWAYATLKMLLGFGLLCVNNPFTIMVGFVFAMHFGLCHLLSLTWRSLGVDAKPLMNNPFLATSLGDFWGRRWNVAFRDLSQQFVFKPLRRTPYFATFAVFLVSGLLHDLVMSVPAGSGYGLPTLYFLLQFLGVMVERRWRWLKCWVFTALVLVLPLPLLLNEGFRSFLVR